MKFYSNKNLLDNNSVIRTLIADYYGDEIDNWLGGSVGHYSQKILKNFFIIQTRSIDYKIFPFEISYF